MEQITFSSQLGVKAHPGGVVTFGYDLAGQRTTVSDPNGSLRLFGFDDGGRLTSASDALGRTTTYGYDAVGRQTQMVDPRGITIDRIFDDAGQLFKERRRLGSGRSSMTRRVACPR